MRPLLIAMLCLSPAAAAQNAAGEKKEPKNPLAGKPEAVEAGKRLFRQSCGACHGPNGEGGRGPNLASGEQVRGKNDQQVFDSIRSGVPGTDMPPSRLPENEVWELVAFVRSFSTPAYESAVPGDPQSGKDLYFGKAGCSGCHAIRGQGGSLGPDLTNIGRTKSVAQLQEALLKPDEAIEEGYRGVTVITANGRKLAGVARNNTNYSIQIQDSNGDLHLLSKRDLREVIFRKSSLMPKDYAQRLSAAEIQDLLAYLGRQSLRTEAPGGHGEN